MGILRGPFRLTWRSAMFLLVACGDPLVSVEGSPSSEAAPMGSVDGPGSSEAAPMAPVDPPRLNRVALMDTPTCPQLEQNENICLVSEFDGPLHLLGLESAQVCPLNAFAETMGSLGWVGNQVYTCDLEEDIVKVSLVDGAVEAKSLVGSHVGCSAVTAWGSRLVLYGRGQISIFASFDEIPNAPIAQYPSNMQASRLAVANDVLLGAWHSTDEVAVFDLASGTDLPAISLVDYDDWVYGLGATLSGEIALLVPDRVGDMQIRDRQTGAIVRTVPTERWFDAVQGMTCGGGSFSSAPPPPPSADPVTVQAECDSNGLSTFDSGASGSPSLHVVSIYQPNANGVVNVHVDRPGDALLVLVAYEDTRWNVTQGPNTLLTAITVRGYEVQTLIAPAGVRTDVESYEADGVSTLPYSHDWSSYEARKLRFDVEQMTNLPMRSYSGCYEGASFAIE